MGCTVCCPRCPGFRKCSKGAGVVAFFLLFALISAWVGASILLVGFHAGGVVVDIYIVVVVIVLYC